MLEDRITLLEDKIDDVSEDLKSGLDKLDTRLDKFETNHLAHIYERLESAIGSISWIKGAFWVLVPMIITIIGILGYLAYEIR